MEHGTAGQWRPAAARSKEGFMIRAFILAALEVFPWLLRPVSEIFLADGDGDNRGSLDPNG
jgi:hypothetical protein